MSDFKISTSTDNATDAATYIKNLTYGSSDTDTAAAVAVYNDTTNNIFGIVAGYYDSDLEGSNTCSLEIPGAAFGSVSVSDAGALQFLTPDSVVIDTVTQDDLRTAANVSNVDNTADEDKPVSTALTTALAAKVTAVDGMGLSSNDFTDDEKTKLASLDSKNLGYYASESALLTVYPNSNSSLSITTGSYAYVTITDSDDNETVYLYTYDASELLWTQGDAISSTTLTGAEIKTLYEAQEDTNAYTDDEKTKLSNIQAGAEVNTVSTVCDVSPDANNNITLTADSIGLGDYDGTTPDTLPLNDVQAATVEEIGGYAPEGRVRMFMATSIKNLKFAPLKGGSITIGIDSTKRNWRIINGYSSEVSFTVASFYEDEPTTAWDSGRYEYGKDITVSAGDHSGWHPLQRNGMGENYEVQKGNHCTFVIIDKTNVACYEIDIFGLTNHRFIISSKVATEPVDLDA